MDDSEKISGKKIFDILDQLKNDHTILNIHVMGTDFDGLSIILGVSDGENPRFFIDYPGGANSFTLFEKGKKCYFEFSDQGKIKYSFKTTIHNVFGKRIKFNFPEFIERTQRRKVFRVSVPSNTRLVCSNNDIQFKFDIINISEGGLLACLDGKNHRKDILFKGNKLRNLILSIEIDYKPVKINVKTAEIMRLVKIDENRTFNYGLKFTEMDKMEQDELKRFIYYCQRKELQKREKLKTKRSIQT